MNDPEERANFAKAIRDLIESKLGEEIPTPRIKAEGKLLAMEYHDNELGQARAWKNFLEVLTLFLEGQLAEEIEAAKKSPRAIQLRKDISDLGCDISSAGGQIDLLKIEARREERRKARYNPNG